MSTLDNPFRRHRSRQRGVGLGAALLLGALATTALTGGATATRGAVSTPELVPAIAAPTSELSATDADAWLDGLLPSAIDRAGIAGAAVTIVKDGKILTSRGFGVSDVSEQTPVDPDQTLFRVGSVSKLFTATAVMQLVERGELDLDADVDEYLDFDIPRNFAEPITLRNLLTHTAGFEERIRGLISFETAGSLRDALATDPPQQQFEPGTTPSYSNYGNALAGYIVERVSGQPFADYVDEKVLRASGMDDSTFGQPLPEGFEPRMSRGYSDDTAEPLPFEFVPQSPAGALSATSTDMARFMIAQLGDATEGRDILQPETLEQLQAPGLEADTLGAFADGPRMTLGFFDESRNGQRIVGHGGDTTVFHSHLQLYPDDGTGIFVTFNSTGRQGIETLELRDAVMHGFSDRYFPAVAADAPVEESAKSHAALAQGTYQSTRLPYSTFASAIGLTGQTSVVAQPDGSLLVSPGPSSVNPMVLEETAPWVWSQVDGDEVITMKVEDDTVTAIGFSSAFTMTRVDSERDGAAVLPILGLAAGILLFSLLAWPIGALTRRMLRAPVRHARGRREWRVLTRVGIGSALVGLTGWVVAISLAANLQDLADTELRVLQGVQVIGVLGLVPAVAWIVDSIRSRIPWWRIAARVTIVLSLGVVAWFAFAFKLIAPSVSY